MADQTRASIPIRDFTGLNLNTDSRDQEPGQAVDQVNMTCQQEGMLQTRGGFRFIAFEDD